MYLKNNNEVLLANKTNNLDHCLC